MRSKVFLLSSVSAIATLAASSHAAVAADAPMLPDAVAAPEGYTFSVQGGVLFSGVDQTLATAADKLGSGFDNASGNPMADTDIGYTGAFTIGKKLDSGWDVQFGASVNQFIENSGDVSAYSNSSYTSTFNGSGYLSAGSGFNIHSSGTTRFGFETMDFEVGYSPTLDQGMNVRLFAGVRALHFKSDDDFTGGIGGYSSFYASGIGGSGSSYSSFSYDISQKFSSEFFGAGPRVGASMSTRFEGTSFGLSGMLAGAYIYGHQNDKADFSGVASGYSGISGSPSSSYYSAGSNSISSGGNKGVVDLQASAGIDYYLDDTSVLTFGYQAEKLLNIGPLGDDQQDKLVHGPIIKLSGQF